MQKTNKTSDLSSELSPKTRNTLGERLREIWTESGVKQEEFAKRLGVTTVTLCKLYERGEKARFRLFAGNQHRAKHLFGLVGGRARPEADFYDGTDESDGVPTVRPARRAAQQFDKGTDAAIPGNA